MVVAQSKEILLTNLVGGAKSYSELRKTLSVTETAFLKHLRDLTETGLIAKNQDDRYVLTQKGNRELRRTQLSQLAYQPRRAIFYSYVPTRSLRDLYKALERTGRVLKPGKTREYLKSVEVICSPPEILQREDSETDVAAAVATSIASVCLTLEAYGFKNYDILITRREPKEKMND